MTMLFDNSPLTTAVFLADYWQKKPLLIRQALPGFTPELVADDIAGLACDELAESRLVTGHYPEHDWTLRYGPFSENDFKQLPESGWTLLVQDVGKHYPPLRRLIEAFDFIPRWRIDDLMISVAGPGGSVGPHVDQYDVFLLQAEGTRQWQIAKSFEPKLLADCELNVLEHFSAEDEWVLQAGDMLYLPPGVAHHGIALDQGMTWSIGMRAPSTADLLQSLGEWLADTRGEGRRYRDPALTNARHIGEVDAGAVERFRQLSRSIGDGDFAEFLGSFLSRYRLAHEPAPAAEALEPDGLARALQRGAILQHNPWTRLLWIEAKSGAILFAAGTAYHCSMKAALTICDPPGLEHMQADESSETLALCCDLLNQGHLYLEGSA